MKTEYLENRELTIVDVARKYGQNDSYVWQIAAREGWKSLKEKKWKEAADLALEEVSGGIKDLVTRHAKMARYMQAGAMVGIKTIVEAYQKNPQLLTEDGLDANMLRSIVGLAGEGLKAERELYPKQMQIQSDMHVLVEEIPVDMVESFYAGFKAVLTSGKTATVNAGKSRNGRRSTKAIKPE